METVNQFILNHPEIEAANRTSRKELEESKIRSLYNSYPLLIPIDGTLPSRVVAAKNIRIELKEAFPGIKFSVKTRSFSMGDDINVAWTDGPTSKQVDAIIQKYCAGSFDGMVDLYTYNSSAWTKAFGDAKYISANRHYSDALERQVIEALKKKYSEQEAPTVEDYNQGKAWNTTPMSRNNGRVDQHWCWQSIINRALEEQAA